MVEGFSAGTLRPRALARGQPALPSSWAPGRRGISAVSGSSPWNSRAVGGGKTQTMLHLIIEAMRGCTPARQG
jgi:hypothetical protein